MDDHPYLHVPPEAVSVPKETVQNLPESARRILDAVVAHGPVTHPDLRELTGMPSRTIRYAVRRLKDEELIAVRASLQDSRTCYFFVHPKHVDQRVVEQLRGEAAEGPGYVVQAHSERPRRPWMQ